MIASRILFSLWIAYRTSSSQITGPNDQECGLLDDDNPPDACPIIDGTFTSLESSIIECEENLDCCLCSSITCGGGGSAGTFCDKFVAGGDLSAFFVRPISITGSSDDGAEIECGGDSSCEGTQITGTNIKKMKCGGDRSCYGVNWDLTCMSSDPCDMECDGDASCGSSTIEITNVEKVKCGEELSCTESTFTITNPEDDKLEIECGDTEACRDLTVNIIIESGANVNNIKGIKCNGLEACKGMAVNIDNRQSTQVTVEEIDCNGDSACVEATFSGTNVIYEAIKCDGNSCDSCTVGGSSCNSQASALITHKRESNTDWKVLSSVDSTKRWVLLSLIVVFGILMVICCGYICIVRLQKLRNKEQEMDGIEMGHIQKDGIVEDDCSEEGED